MAQTILTSTQKQILKALSGQKSIIDHFYLSGGTALAEYYLYHRYSEDLDFFSYENFEPIDIQVIFKIIKTEEPIKHIDFQQSFNRNLFFIHFAGEVVKTEFTYYPFLQLQEPKIAEGLKIDSILDIAVNKVFTIYQSPRSRDFIDLYLILQNEHWTFEELKKNARIKFDTHLDPLQMAKQLLMVHQVKDYPRMIIPLIDKNWQQFWMQEAEKLKNDALK